MLVEVAVDENLRVMEGELPGVLALERVQSLLQEALAEARAWVPRLRLFSYGFHLMFDRRTRSGHESGLLTGHGEHLELFPGSFYSTQGFVSVASDMFIYDTKVRTEGNF